jgi:hypothetical protein
MLVDKPAGERTGVMPLHEHDNIPRVYIAVIFAI